MTDSPFPFEWTGEAMAPVGPWWARRAGERFVAGRRYRLIELHGRSEASHRHYFACLGEVWGTFRRIRPGGSRPPGTFASGRW